MLLHIHAIRCYNTQTACTVTIRDHVACTAALLSNSVMQSDRSHVWCSVALKCYSSAVHLVCWLPAVVCARWPLFRQQPSPKNKTEQCDFVFWVECWQCISLQISILGHQNNLDLCLIWSPFAQGEYLAFYLCTTWGLRGKTPCFSNCCWNCVCEIIVSTTTAKSWTQQQCKQIAVMQPTDDPSSLY